MPERGPGSRRALRLLLLCTRILNPLVLALMVTVAVVVCGLSLLTWNGFLRVHDELSGSMAPAIEVGDLIVYRPVPAARLRRGDVISFLRADDKASVTHRVQSVRLRGNTVEVGTRGDANTENDRVPAIFGDQQVVWRAKFVVPGTGFALAAVMGGHGLPLMLGLVPLYLMLPWIQDQLTNELASAPATD